METTTVTVVTLQQVLPVIDALSRVSMRARHWNDVITAVGTSFPHSDAAVFCVGHVMDCSELLEQKTEIEVP
jgi:hypothetical protein